MAYGSNPPRDTTDFDYWKECERVAMHFNDLLMRFRIQAIAALTASGALLGFAAADGSMNWPVLAVGLFALLVIWYVIGFIDAKYYYPLLRGAVAELREVEKASGNRFNLSTRIETKWCREEDADAARTVFYVVPGLLLLVLALTSYAFSIR